MSGLRVLALGVVVLGLLLLGRAVTSSPSPASVLGAELDRAESTSLPGSSSQVKAAVDEPLRKPLPSDAAVAAWATTPVAFLTATITEVQEKMRSGRYTPATCNGLAAAVEEAAKWPPIPRADLESSWRQAIGLIHDGAKLCVVELTARAAGSAITAANATFPGYLDRAWPLVTSVLNEVDAAMTVAETTGLYVQLDTGPPTARPPIVLPGDPTGSTTPSTTTSAPPTDDTRPVGNAVPIVRSGRGTASTSYFPLKAGEYSVEFTFSGPCFYSAILEAAQGVSIYDLGSGAGPLEADTEIRVLQDGSFSVDLTADSTSDCPWSIALTRADPG